MSKSIIVNGRSRYEIEITLPLTLIVGNSGTGKSTLANFLDSKSSVITSPYKFTKLVPKDPDISWETYFTRYTGNIVGFADENQEYIYETDFQRNAAKYGANLLLISRDQFSHMPYGANNVFIVESDDGFMHTVRPILETIPKPVPPYKFLVTEDKKSGYTFFSKFVQNIISADGRCNLYGMMYSYSNAVFVADAVGLGSEAVRLKTALEENRTNTLFLIDSFEEMVLHSYLFNSDFEPEQNIYNKEEAYSKELSRLMTLIGKTYAKGKVNKCIVCDCCTSPPKCKYFKRGSKYDLILGDYKKVFDSFRLPRIDSQMHTDAEITHHF